MYESPINRVISDIQTELQNIDENNLMATVKQSIGYEVNKEELLKALSYDRGQYDTGYDIGYIDGFNDGRKAIISEIIEQFGKGVTE